MSHFKVILTLFLSFSSPALVMGMDFCLPWGKLFGSKKQEFKYSNPYFNPELSKTLLLLMQKNNDQDSFILDKDTIMMIAKGNYDLYREESLEANILGLLQKDIVNNFGAKVLRLRYRDINDQERLNTFCGKKISNDDFDFITMNDEGRKILLRAYLTTACIKEDGKFRHRYGRDIITKELLDEGEKNVDFRVISQDDYEAALKIPLSVRAKLGALSTVKVVGKERLSYFDCFIFAAEAFAGSLLPVIVGKSLEINDKIPLPITLSTMFVGGYYGVWSYGQKREYGIFPTPLSAGSILKGNGGSFVYPEERRKNREFKVEEKSLVAEISPNITLADSIAIKNFGDELAQKQFKALPVQLKKVRSNNFVNLRNRE